MTYEHVVDFFSAIVVRASYLRIVRCNEAGLAYTCVCLVHLRECPGFLMLLLAH